MSTVVVAVLSLIVLFLQQPSFSEQQKVDALREEEGDKSGVSSLMLIDEFSCSLFMPFLLYKG
jgi:hypothetical protein